MTSTIIPEPFESVYLSDDPLTPVDINCCSKEVCLFLTEYAERLLGAGATCMRIEKNIERMAATFGKKVELTIMPRHVHMTVWHPGADDIYTYISTVKPAPISYSLNTRLSQLSWNVADDNLSLRETERCFRKIVSSDYENPWMTLLLASLANACFCGIFGGDWMAMLIVFIATATGFNLKQVLMSKHVDGRAVFFICAFVSAVIGSTGYIFPISSTPAIAVGTSVLYLVPGIPFLNSFNDLLYKHYICAFCRFLDALVLTGCLSLGLILAMKIMNVTLF
ncbi:MAG: threonine/serine exporter family protein [Muribaculaceae bacterium]|nr:threonine/serine exporter family protein [Muribaculaceae bacterium]